MPNEEPSRPLNVIQEELIQVRNSLNALEQEKKLLTADKNRLETEMISVMESLGIENVAFEDNSFIIVNQSVTNIADWDAFIEYVFDTRSDHLLHRRVTQAAAKEAMQLGEAIPGIDMTSITKLSIRKR